ncbi:MAG: MltA domain-containing protein, partial [Rickettsiales bacterium]|nr:MltA domain-containing protein [Rickettsiales bacterium]
RDLMRLLPVLLLLLATACAGQQDHFESSPRTFEEMDGWFNENHVEALAAFRASCPVLAARPKPRTTGSNITIPKKVWESVCNDAQAVPMEPVAARIFFERRFKPYRILNNGKDRGLFTGYYEPTLFGSLRKKGDFQYPLYMAPPEMQKGQSFFSHAEINRGALAGRKLELLYVDDPVMLFFMQIQGSGRVKLADGREMLMGYAGQNGHGYVSLGKIMGDEGYLPKDQVNFFTLRQWLYDHPDQAFGLMERNPSYVFFRKLEQSGPVGSVGVVLTPQRSLAVDPKYIPYGLPLYLETELPALQGEAAPRPFRRMLIAQDTGGAIRGPVRGDIFFGGGKDAEFLAGFMKGRGVYSLLLPKEIVDQLEPEV